MRKVRKASLSAVAGAVYMANAPKPVALGLLICWTMLSTPTPSRFCISSSERKRSSKASSRWTSISPSAKPPARLAKATYASRGETGVATTTGSWVTATRTSCPLCFKSSEASWPSNTSFMSLSRFTSRSRTSTWPSWPVSSMASVRASSKRASSISSLCRASSSFCWTICTSHGPSWP